MKASSVPFLTKSLSVLLLAALLAGCVLMGGAASASAETGELSLADIYEQNVRSTVAITTSGRVSGHYNSGYTYSTAGSGFIITSDGYILTNYHVVKGSDAVSVETYDGDSMEAALIGYDEDSDIAILKVEAANLKPVTIGDSDKLRVGESVCAIGNPLGELAFSLTHGIVSALSRSIKTSSGTQMTLIQTDCSINSGNSGGALFNSRGEVVGITNAKFSSSGFYSESEIDNICFAIPVNSVTRIVTSVIENGYVLKPYIGVSVSPLSEEISVITGIQAGAVVRDVTAGAPADQAGIRINDVIVKIGSDEIADSKSLVQAISKAEPGDVLTFTIFRQGQEIQLDVVIGSKTESAMKKEEAAEETPAPQQLPQDGWQGGNGWGGNPFEDFFNFYFGY